jgi:tRNA (guanine37-N1)-methyltransferase
LKLDVFTLFPEHFDWFLRQRHVSNALARDNELRFHNYRDTTPLSAGQVDDAPYGGGAGMVMRVDVVDTALDAAYGADRDRVRKIALAPAGRLFDEGLAVELAEESHVALLCGR